MLNRSEVINTLREKSTKSAVMGLGNVENLVNEIYNSFENMTCENCKFYSSLDYTCSNNDIDIMVDPEGKMSTYMKVYSNFGCNKFKRKIDDNKRDVI